MSAVPTIRYPKRWAPTETHTRTSQMGSDNICSPHVGRRYTVAISSAQRFDFHVAVRHVLGPTLPDYGHSAISPKRVDCLEVLSN